MPVPVTLNGTVYQIPVQGDQRWAPPLTRYLIALASATLQPVGGTFTLTGDVNFGATYGLLSAYFSSRNTPATSGLIRLSKTDTIDWRNNAGSGNNILSTDASDNLVWNGTIISSGFGLGLADGKIWIGSSGGLPVAQTLTGDVTVSDVGLTSIGALKIVNAQVSNSAAIAYSKLSLTGSIVNNDIYASAGIAYSKLALSNSIVNGDIAAAAAIAYSKLATLTASKVLVSDGSGVVSASTVTTTTLGFLDPTSSIQGQLNGKQATLTTGNLTELTSGVLTIGGGTGAVIGTGTTITVTAATDSVPGYMTAADHTALTGVISSNSGKVAKAGDTMTGALTINPVSNQLVLGGVSAGKTTTISSTAPAANEVYTIPDAGHAANFVLDQGNYTIAGTWSFTNAITGTLTGGASLDLPLTGGTLTGDLTLANQHAIIFKELATNGTTAVTINAPATVTGSYDLTLPAAVAGAGQYLYDAAGNGTLSWNTPSGSGTVNSGTAGQLAYYATSTTAVSGATPTVSGSTITASLTGHASLDLALAGGTMSGAIAMGTNKITGLGNGTAAQDAATFSQLIIVQVRVFTSTTVFATTSNAFQTTNLSGSFTMTNASNKVLAYATGLFGPNGDYCVGTIYRDSVGILTAPGACVNGASSSHATMIGTDSPADTSAHTYTVKIHNNNNSQSVSFGGGGFNTLQTLVLIETTES